MTSMVAPSHSLHLLIVYHCRYKKILILDRIFNLSEWTSRTISSKLLPKSSHYVQSGTFPFRILVLNIVGSHIWYIFLCLLTSSDQRKRKCLTFFSFLTKFFSTGNYLHSVATCVFAVQLYVSACCSGLSDVILMAVITGVLLAHTSGFPVRLLPLLVFL
jgi:hypothetical protein